MPEWECDGTIMAPYMLVHQSTHRDERYDTTMISVLRTTDCGLEPHLPQDKDRSPTPKLKDSRQRDNRRNRQKADNRPLQHQYPYCVQQTIRGSLRDEVNETEQPPDSYPQSAERYPYCHLANSRQR